MKKLLAILALVTAGTAFAGSATVEYQNMNGTGSTPTADQTNFSLTVRETLTKGVVGDLGLSQTNNKNGSAVDTLASTRAEAGVTGSVATGPVSPYVRVAIGQKFTSADNFTYYSVEPGVSAPLGGGFTAKLGYRFRDSFDSGKNDTTRTWRAGVAYDLTKKDQIGVRYDRVRGDTEQNVVAVNYTRSF